VRYDFQGRLPFSWPRSACQTPLNAGDPDYDPLFPLGFALSYRKSVDLPQLDETPGPAAGCSN
jgi:beta-glucosidase